MLFQELNRFVDVLEDIVYTLNVAIPREVYDEQKAGLENFLESYGNQTKNRNPWIEKIWKRQKNYLEKIDTLLEALQCRGKVFDYPQTNVYRSIMAFYRDYVSNREDRDPGPQDFGFIANGCAKAVVDDEPKTLWSGDVHIASMLKALYSNASGLDVQLPEIYLRASYAPRRYARLFP